MISVTILTKNSAKHITEVLEALTPFEEIVVYDTGSTDQTRAIAERFPNVRFLEAPFQGFGPTHNQAAAKATHEWILSIDSDEVLTPELAQEILSLKLEDDTVYALERHNFYRGTHVRWCGWHPDRVVRLYNRKATAFSEAMVHERVLGERVIQLKAPLRHYPYDSISDFLVKMERYSTLFAEQYRGKRSATPLSALGHGLGAFFKSYVLKKGFLGGYTGWLIAAYNGHTAFYKYLKLYEANRCSSSTD